MAMLAILRPSVTSGRPDGESVPCVLQVRDYAMVHESCH
jgi:hypothetical protein